MKKWLALAAVGLCFFSCKKEMESSVSQSTISDEVFFNTVKSELKDSLSADDFSSIDVQHWYKSKDVQSDKYFVRIAFQKRELETDFMLLKTDSLGNISQGRIIHIDKNNNPENTNTLSFQGQFIISSLNRASTLFREVVNGRWKQQTGENSLVSGEPAGTQTLPEVVVTSYKSNGSSSGTWYLYGAFFDDYNNSGSTMQNTGYLYGSSGGGAGSGSSGTSNTDNTEVIEVEFNDDGPIKPEDYIKCFGTLSDVNAQYTITIYSDIPVDGHPEESFNWSTGSPGHSFIQLSKTSGGQTIQQYFGFYPQTGYKALGPIPTASEIVDNSGHEYNASLTKTVSSSQFQAETNMIVTLENNKYNIDNWNCTNFALSVFNAGSNSPLTVSAIHIGSDNIQASPQALYNQIQNLQATGSKTYGNPSTPSTQQHASNGHGSCGGK